MAYVALTSRVAGNPILVSDWNKNKNNWDAVVDAATSKIETDVVVADSITAGAVGTSEIATDGVGQDEIAATSVGRGEIKSSTEEVSQAASIGTWYNKEFTNPSTWGFHPNFRTDSGGALSARFQEADSGITSYTTRIAFMVGAASNTVYSRMGYIQASPPYCLGDIEPEDWGMFLWLVRKANGEIVSARRCMDAPWSNQAKLYGIPKNHPAAIFLCPHPFGGDTMMDSGKRGELPPGCSITLVDLREFRVPVKPNKAQRELASLQAKRLEFAAKGIPLHVLDGFEAEAAKKSEAEAAQILAWENELGQIDAKAEETIRRLGAPEMRTYNAWVQVEHARAYPGAEELQRTTVRRGEKLNQVMVLLRWQEEYRRRTEHEMAAVVPSLHRKAEKRRAWLTRQLFGRTMIDDIERDLEAEGTSILQALTDDGVRCGVNWKALREADTTLPGGADVPGMKEAGVRVVCK